MIRGCKTFVIGVLPIMGVMLGLSACQFERMSSLQRYPTADPTQLSGIASPTPTSDPAMPTGTSTPQTPIPMVTAPPAVVIPDASGVMVACQANTLRLTLDLPGGDTGRVASRILAVGDDLYLLVDGGMYRIRRIEADSGSPVLEPALVPGEVVAGRPVQELADIAVGEVGEIYALDKAGHVIRYEPVAGGTALTYRATPEPTLDQDLDIEPQLVALEVDGRGQVIVLDTANGGILSPAGIQSLEVINLSRSLISGVDLAAVDGKFYVLRQDGTIRLASDSVGTTLWRDADGRRLGLALKRSDHLGIDLLFTVDALRREVVGFIPRTAQPVTKIDFAFPDLGLLRDVVFAGERLYALADGDLLIYPGPDSGDSAACPSPDPDRYAPPTLYGSDILTALQDAIIPIENAPLPPWPRVYPGASRLYRMGVHYGLDFYGLRVGRPVLAAADGMVVRSTLAYTEMSRDEFERLIAEANALGMTSPEALQRLSGKQVIIDHGNGIRSVYSHLDAIAPGIVTGARVRSGQLVGTVGVTGTQGESEPGTVGPHLHFELWIGDRYLGYGVTIREVMWWIEGIFG